MASPPRRILLVGGGHAHVQVLKGLRHEPSCHVTLVSDGAFSVYSGMLPGVVAGYYRPEAIRVDLAALCAWAGADFVCGRVVAQDLDRQSLRLEDGRVLHYNWLSLNVGSATQSGGAGMASHSGVMATRPIDALLGRLEEAEGALMSRRQPQTAQRPAACVVGGGMAGVELAFALRERWARLFGGCSVVLIASADRVPQGASPALSAAVHRELETRGVILRCGSRAVSVSAAPGVVTCSDGAAVPFDALVWAAGAAPLSGFPGCFIPVRHTLQTCTHDNVFAVGDCCSFPAAPGAFGAAGLPKAGVFSVRGGSTLIANLKEALAAEREGRAMKLAAFEPNPEFLSLALVGGRVGVGGKYGVVMRGRWVWTLKDVIDRRWMEMFKEFAGGAEFLPAAVSAPGATAVRGGTPQSGEGDDAAAIQAEAAAALAVLQSGVDDDDAAEPGTPEAVAQDILDTERVAQAEAVLARMASDIAFRELVVRLHTCT